MSANQGETGSVHVCKKMAQQVGKDALYGDFVVACLLESPLKRAILTDDALNLLMGLP